MLSLFNNITRDVHVFRDKALSKQDSPLNYKNSSTSGLLVLAVKSGHVIPHLKALWPADFDYLSFGSISLRCVMLLRQSCCLTHLRALVLSRKQNFPLNTCTSLAIIMVFFLSKWWRKNQNKMGSMLVVEYFLAEKPMRIDEIFICVIIVIDSFLLSYSNASFMIVMCISAGSFQYDQFYRKLPFPIP